MIVLDMLNNLALLALISVFSGFVGKRYPNGKRAAVFQGLLFGCASVIGMLRPVVMSQGIHYDGRSVMISLCGLFFGPLSSSVAAGIALVCRIAQGGSGALTGSLVIAASALLGIVFHFRQPREHDEIPTTRLLMMGLCVHAVMLFLMFTLPGGVAVGILKRIAWPVMLAYPFATVLIGKILSDKLARDLFLGQLQKSEERFRTTLYSIGDGLITTDTDSKVCQLNPVAEKLTGWSETAAKGRRCEEVFRIINENSRATVESPVTHVLREGKVVGLANHTLLLGRDGAERPIADSGAPILDTDGNVTGVVLVFRDQTAERAAQKALLQSEARYQTLFANAPVGVFTATSAGRLLNLNGTMARLLGFTSPQAAIDRLKDDDTPLSVCPCRQRAFLHRLADNGSVEDFEYETRTADGRTVWLNVSARVTDRQSDGTFTLDGFATDITGRKRSEQESARNTDRLNMLLRILQYPTRKIQELLDYALAEVILLTRSKIGYIYHYDADRKEFILNTWSKDVMKECAVIQPQTCYELDKTGIWGEAVRQRRPIVVNDFAAANPLKKGVPRGHVKLERFLTVPIFREDTIVGVVGVANKASDYDEDDVVQVQVLMSSVWKEVERKKSEEAREKLEVQFRQSQKMEAVGRLAGGVAHDFNNILQSMIGYGELLVETLSGQGQGEPRGFAQEIVSEGKRAAALTSQLLAFARKQTISPKVFDLNEAITSMLKMLSRLLGENIDLCWKPGERLWPVKMDPTQLDQILTNLTVNARDAVIGGGRMTIETCAVCLDDDYCASHAGLTPGNYILLTVSDNGCGMDRQTQEELFEPFFTTKSRGKGTGLGLATVYGIVRQNHGFITVDSEPQKGTTFNLFLPPCMDELPCAENPEPALMAPQTGSETVLIVDDEESILRSGCRILESLGYTVLAASDPDSALRLSQEHAGEIHLLLTDVVMPNLSGRDLKQKLLPDRPRMKCLYMSGYTANVIAHHGVLDEGIHFLQKPFSKISLATKIREVLSAPESA